MNRLQYETSPYLLQHKHNPVDWYPWGEEALQKAKEEKKVILVSIGYSACHWCHVMERESFENAETARLMNENFINIKIDREERPDLDHIYMDAVQAVTGSGGWPLNVFLTPETKPFYGGTYFPPVRAYNRISWREVLHNVQEAWKNRRHEILAQAEEIIEHLKKSNSFGAPATPLLADEKPFAAAACHTIFENIMKQADDIWGGYGQAPKFPQTFTTGLLLQYYYFTNNEKALAQALLTLDKIIAGGIHDHVGGGFARYSTDNEWLAPHFEKMLYDNALLLCNLADAFAITRLPLYEHAIRKTIGFLQREMKNNEGGYFAAIDADSEGEEGKFYTWDKAEIDTVLGNDSPLFCRYFDVTENGNWEEKTILRNLETAEKFCTDNNLTIQQLNNIKDECLAKLLKKRNERIRPQTDDKILLGWNALLITALCKCAGSLAGKEFEEMAENCWEFLITKFEAPGTQKGFYHTWKNGEAKYPAFLDDYAYLIQAAIHLQEKTCKTGYLEKAKQVMEYVIEHFSDEKELFFWFTGRGQTDVVIQKTEVYDGATPSGNAVMAQNLLYLGIVFNKPGWVERAVLMVKTLENAITRYPGSFGIWASLLFNVTAEMAEIAIVGEKFNEFNNQLLTYYFPNKILQASLKQNPGFPLLADKETDEGYTFLFMCKGYACQQPYSEPGSLVKYLQSINKF